MVTKPVRVLYSQEEQPLLSRSTIIPVNNSFTNPMAIISEKGCASIRSISKGNTLQSLSHDRVLDIKSMISSDDLNLLGKRPREPKKGTDFLCTVSSNSLRLYST